MLGTVFFLMLDGVIPLFDVFF